MNSAVAIVYLVRRYRWPLYSAACRNACCNYNSTNELHGLVVLSASYHDSINTDNRFVRFIDSVNKRVFHLKNAIILAFEWQLLTTKETMATDDWDRQTNSSKDAASAKAKILQCV